MAQPSRWTCATAQEIARRMGSAAGLFLQSWLPAQWLPTLQKWWKKNYKYQPDYRWLWPVFRKTSTLIWKNSEKEWPVSQKEWSVMAGGRQTSWRVCCCVQSVASCQTPTWCDLNGCFLLNSVLFCSSFGSGILEAQRCLLLVLVRNFGYETKRIYNKMW